MGENIRMCLTEIAVDTRNWIDSAQDSHYWRALVSAAFKLRVQLAMEELL